VDTKRLLGVHASACLRTPKGWTRNAARCPPFRVSAKPAPPCCLVSRLVSPRMRRRETSRLIYPIRAVRRDMRQGLWLLSVLRSLLCALEYLFTHSHPELRSLPENSGVEGLPKTAYPRSASPPKRHAEAWTPNRAVWCPPFRVSSSRLTTHATP
jgi:hypothetical protein